MLLFSKIFNLSSTAFLSKISCRPTNATIPVFIKICNWMYKNTDQIIKSFPETQTYAKNQKLIHILSRYILKHKRWSPPEILKNFKKKDACHYMLWMFKNTITIRVYKAFVNMAILSQSGTYTICTTLSLTINFPVFIRKCKYKKENSCNPAKIQMF